VSVVLEAMTFSSAQGKRQNRILAIQRLPMAVRSK
jgi:hypothetical protein